MKGTHNTLSYARPKHWWWLLLTPFWRCQRLDLAGQVAAGVRAFDIRFVRNASGFGWHSAHGLVDLDIDPVEAILQLSRICPGAAVRCILEKGNDYDRQVFGETCQALERQLPGLGFYEGIYKPTWTRIHRFASARSRELERDTIHYYASHVGGKVWGLFPRLWARLHRRDVVHAEADGRTPVLRDWL